LDNALKLKEKYVQVKQAGREVDAMLSEDQMNYAIQQKMAELPGITRDEAEILILKATGRLGKPIQVIQPPAPPAQTDLSKKIDDVISNRLEQLLFPTPKDGNETKGSAQNMAQTIQAAQERGVNSLQLLDGTVLHFGKENKGDSFGEIASQRAMKWGQDKLEQILEGGSGSGSGKIDPNAVAGMNPEVLKILFENEARHAEIEATVEVQKTRYASIKSLSDLAGSVFKPGGLNTLQGIFNMLRTQGQEAANGDPTGEAPTPNQAPPEQDKFPPVECANPACKHVQRIQRGMTEYVCEKCGETNEDIEFP